MPEIPQYTKSGSFLPFFPTLILLEPKLRNLRFSRPWNASMGIESKKLNDRSSSTRLVSSGRENNRFGGMLIARGTADFHTITNERPDTFHKRINLECHIVWLALYC